MRAMTDHWSPTAVHFEAFSEAETHKADDKPFKVKLAGSGTVLDIPTTKTILEVLRDHGLDVPSSCETGNLRHLPDKRSQAKRITAISCWPTTSARTPS